eukprot:gnl/TRDRNA2_/TRDRNA2_177336_c1_seq19.p1 gnl/TRDRNA2_/TRDRNA2_177336_c1~~gnl/TRDRNA2_/TRDRNA2_177336_c1_seq19.p1  ORF type:complete len:723 (+),score=273.51 gnl/TRDRNA2_/TRDRNA2_177336_c1_seq19:236-2170(+)
MLKDMEKEAEEDEEIYDKMACWCETGDKDKKKSIADAEARIDDLTSKVEELTALSAQLNTEVKNLEQEVAKNQNALDQATAMRKKELAEFNAEEKDMLGTISSLKSAVTVLSKHNSMIQVSTSTSQINTVAANIQKIMQQHTDMLKHILTHSERKAVATFMQSPQDYFDAEPTFKQSYAPQSGEIFGVLSQMKETFESNLATSQQEETTNAKAYEDLKAAKEEEIASGQAMLDKKTNELATADEKNAEAKEDLTDTKSTLAADEEFLNMLKEQCANVDAEWEERQKTRQLEMESCSKALAVLSSDDAHDTFSSTFSLVQIRSAPDSMGRSEASRALWAAAKRSHNHRLATLAYKLKSDPFEKVKAAIDKMIESILRQKDEEVKHRDFCIDELNTNQLQTEKKEREKQDLTALKEDLTNTIEVLTGQINKLKSEISEAQVQLKRAGEDREAENKEFQKVVADQRATQKLLQKALAVLEGFYGKKAAAFVQEQQKQQQPAGPPPPPGFKSYKKNAASGGVMSMIQQIINDAKAMETEAIKAEDDAQNAYEGFVKETNEVIETKTKDMINKSEEKSKAESDLVQAGKEYDATMMELEHLANYNGELHSSCDFVLKNFEESQAAKDGEVEALKQAIASMSGSTALVQK